MRRVVTAEERFTVREPARSGRPPRELAGDVDRRILDAARELFFERGLSGASMDEIAFRARAGKPTVYTRFPTKEALFTAVVMRSLASTLAHFESYVPPGETIKERLEGVGRTILHWALVGDTIGLARLAIAEALRFPDLASRVYLMMRERAREAEALLLSEVAQSGELESSPAFAPERLATTTRFFQDLVVVPLIMRALFGEQLDVLRAEIEPHVAETVAFFLAACRYGETHQNEDDGGRWS